MNGDVAEAKGTEVANEVTNDWILKTLKRRKLPRPDSMIIKHTEKLSFSNAPELNSPWLHLMKGAHLYI